MGENDILEGIEWKSILMLFINPELEWLSGMKGMERPKRVNCFLCKLASCSSFLGARWPHILLGEPRFFSVSCEWEILTYRDIGGRQGFFLKPHSGVEVFLGLKFVFRTKMCSQNANRKIFTSRG